MVEMCQMEISLSKNNQKLTLALAFFFLVSEKGCCSILWANIGQDNPVNFRHSDPLKNRSSRLF